VILGLYSAGGSAWLMLVYWSGLSRYFVSTPASVAVEVQPGRERLPWLGVLVSVALVCSALSLVAAGPQRTIGILAELLPTSGGTGEYDPYAHGGVNDGDEETKGDNANSTGHIQTDTFLDSPLPTLYDMFNDMYGEPFKPKECERAIALDARTKVIESKKKPADNQRPNREFPTSRKSPQQLREVSDRTARALFEVQGRTPLHVRVTAFDAFDGVAWHEAPVNCNVVRIEKQPRSNWMMLIERVPPPVFAERESHQFKITTPQGTFVPTPPHLQRFRVGRVNQADFFGWGQDRILRLSQRKTPSGIMVETESRAVDRRLLVDLDFSRAFNGEQDAALPENLKSEVATLAHAWAGGQAEGWPQIALIVNRLRTEYTLDATARVPDNCEDPLGHFLFQAKRGPDYQFASAAAVLVRALGYPTRLVSGFYASPEHYDSETGHTPVVAEDLHFWAEVMLPSGDWLVIDPTPGYEVLRPSLSPRERIVMALITAASWSYEHGIEIGFAVVFLGVTWWWRRSLTDTAIVAWWRWFPARRWYEVVRHALWLLALRASWAGRARHQCQTVSDWLSATLGDVIEGDAELQQISRMFEWAAYASELPPPWTAEDVKRICEIVLARWTVRRWQATGVAAGRGA
jgi:transglutaminase-like putative cysteine protease